MKKLLLLFSTILIASVATFAQCTPDAGCTDAACPAPGTTFSATDGQAFSQTITLNVAPTITVPGGGPVPPGTYNVDSLEVTNVTGLPTGVTWTTSCGVTTRCAHTPGAHCMLLDGTPTGGANSYNITIEATLWVLGQPNANNMDYVIDVGVPGPPVLTTKLVTYITETTAKTGGDITNDGGAAVTARGVVWSTTPGPTVPSANSTSDGTGTGAYFSDITGLTNNTQYHVRAYATNANGTDYGAERIFTTGTPLCTADPSCNNDICPDTLTVFNGVKDHAFSETITLIVPSSITTPIAADVDSVVVTSVTNLPTGMSWSTICGAQLQCTYLSGANCIILDGTPTVGFNDTITIHTTNYVTSATFGAQQLATVSRYIVIITGPPVITTTASSNISYTSATTGGDVTADGNSTVTERGIVYGTATLPTLATGTKVMDQTPGVGPFTSNITGLTDATMYYVRAYATNANGTSYGNEITFTTLTISSPTVTTAASSSVTFTSAITGGDVTSDGGAAVTERGVVYATTTGPTLATGTKVMDGATGTGAFTSNLTGLTHSTTYYVVAYAINSSGTSYGNEIIINTLVPSAPTVASTTAASAVTETTATSGGDVTDDGGDAITERGIVWSINPNPDIATGTKVVDASTTTGTFTSNISGLTNSTQYYVRAYATNGIGTTYGNQETFTTITPLPPTVTTTPASGVGSTTANSGGTITSDGGYPVTARGVVYSTNPTPTLASGNFTTDGTGTGSYVSSITGLTAATTYYIRAYATNSIGTSYGAEITILTLSPPTVTTTLLKNSPTIIYVQGNVTSDGNAAITARGVVWGDATAPTINLGTKTADAASAIGTYSVSARNLTPGATYYVRAYATNANGTAYGNEYTVTTPSLNLSCVPDSAVTLADPGVTPSDIIRLPNGTSNFSQVFTYVLPTSYTYVGPNDQGDYVNLGTATPDSAELLSIVDLPTGLSYTCGNPSCMFYAGTIGCFTVYGTLPAVDDETYEVKFSYKDYGVLDHNQHGLIALEGFTQQGNKANGITIELVDTSSGGSLLPPTGIEEYDENQLALIAIGPNPFDGAVKILYNNPGLNDIYLTVHDIYGRQVASILLNAGAGENTFNFEGGSLTPGTYFFTITDGKARSTHALIAR